MNQRIIDDLNDLIFTASRLKRIAEQRAEFSSDFENEAVKVISKAENMIDDLVFSLED